MGMAAAKYLRLQVIENETENASASNVQVCRHRYQHDGVLEAEVGAARSEYLNKMTAD